MADSCSFDSAEAAIEGLTGRHVGVCALWISELCNISDRDHERWADRIGCQFGRGAIALPCLWQLNRAFLGLIVSMLETLRPSAWIGQVAFLQRKH
jgi:hypothetical protein